MSARPGNLQNRMLPRTLRAGCLAYLDTFAGLVPVRVESVSMHGAWPHVRADVTVTATRGAYRKGERILDWPAKDCPPRDAVRYRNGVAFIQRFAASPDGEG